MMNTGKQTTDSTEMLNRIERFAYDADWTIEELRESLQVQGIDPDLALKTIKSRLSPLYKFKESPTEIEKIVGENEISLTVFPGIIVAAENIGINISQLSVLTGWSEIFLLKLDRRLVSVEGRSKSIAAIIADKINSAVEPIQKYISGQSLYPAEANFKAETQPEIPEKQSFEEAVDSDPLLSNDIKAFLKSLQDEK